MYEIHKDDTTELLDLSSAPPDVSDRARLENSLARCRWAVCPHWGLCGKFRGENVRKMWENVRKMWENVRKMWENMGKSLGKSQKMRNKDD